MNNFLVFGAIFLSVQTVYSQADFREGFVITTQGDSLAGFVDYREGGKNYTTCSFRRSDGGNVIDYHPDQLKRYGFLNDKQFLSDTIAAGDDSVAVFLEILVEGSVSLYHYQNRFFAKKDDRLLELTNDVISRIENGQTMVGNSRKYLGILNFLLHDCPDTKRKLNNVGFNEQELTLFVQEYNACTGGVAVTYKENKAWLTVNFSAEVSYIRSYLTFVSTKPAEYHLQADFIPENTVAFGFLVRSSSPRINERISFIAGLRYLSMRYVSNSVNGNSFHTYYNEVIIEVNQLKVPVGFHYSFPEHVYTPYFNLGVAPTYHLSPNDRWIREHETNNTVTTSITSTVSLSGYELGLWGGIGVVRRINDALGMHLELRYEQTNGITRDRTVHATVVRNFELALGINF